MNLSEYRARRSELAAAEPRYRRVCQTCRQPDFGCYCRHLEPFDPIIKFVILIHPIEARRRIATGRMSHLSLVGSELIIGQDYTANERVNALIADPRYQPLVLYPGRASVDLTGAPLERTRALITRRPMVFVIDGTWATARKTMAASRNLAALPRICFTPARPSRFRVRKQPGEACYSTIEAIHETIELLGPAAGFDLNLGLHHGLLRVFDAVVERQLEYLRTAYLNPRATMYRRPRGDALGEYVRAIFGEEPG